jgi:peptidylprolyl isomerase
VGFCSGFRVAFAGDEKGLGKKRLQSVQQRQTGFIERKIPIIVLACVILVASVAVYYVATQGGGGNANQNTNNQNPNNSNSDTTLPNGNETSSTTIKLTTSMGNIVIKLYDDMNITSPNFRNLTQLGVYDGTIFHRVVANFVIQGGDATGKGITVPTILDELPNKHSNIRGSVAMAKKSEANSATSQFYINLKNNTDLDSNYSVFGRVIEGMSVVDAIGSVPTDTNPDSQTYQRPLQTITLTKAEVISQP